MQDICLTLWANHCLFDKSITGCGGTTIEIKSKHNSIIAVPRQYPKQVILSLRLTDTELVNYLNSSTGVL